MILTLILLLVITLTTILVVKNKSKKKDKEIFKIEQLDPIEIDTIAIEVEKPIEPIVETTQVFTPTDQPKKKRKYHKKKHPKKMDANKK
jgi:hypothetical protein